MTAHDGLGSVRADARKNTTETHWDPATARLIDTAVAERDAWWRGRMEALASGIERAAINARRAASGQTDAAWSRGLDAMATQAEAAVIDLRDLLDAAPQPETTPEPTAGGICCNGTCRQPAIAVLPGGWPVCGEHGGGAIDRLAEAVKDVCWRAQQYGQTEDGDTFAYLVTKGAMHRLIGAAQGARIAAAFRTSDEPLPDAQSVPAPPDAPSIEDVLDAHPATHTEHGPLYCPPCSEAIGQWVQWTPVHVAQAIRESGAK
ncbi:hypothetical protein [Nocardioides terrisoli]|uniref:hypothetical protein n=1 Tax=Nocardioides terrisoli TaxID=3388267 RepID=UPI00287B85D5|nr:hypothetical protein [Nocardioides marmorisolisilvae]